MRPRWWGANAARSRGTSRTPSLVFALLLMVFAGLTAGAATRSMAHEIRPTIATMTIHPGGHLELDLSINLEALIAVIGPDHRESSTSANAAAYDRLRNLPPQELQDAFKTFEPTLRAGIALQETGGRRIELGFRRADIGEVGDTGIQRTSTVVYEGQVPSGVTALRWQFAEAFGPSVIRARENGGEVNFSEYLLNGAPSRDIALSNAVAATRITVFLDFLKVGFEHIVPKGLDHILFVVGLFLLSARLAPLLTQATIFTLAHSVTLALGALGIVKVPPSIVEPLIALSIVYVAVENIFTDRLSRWRPFVIFGFGLLHGLGFAGILTEIGMSAADFWTGLVAFNLGVELGQITVIAGCFLTVGVWFGNKAWYRQRITLPLSFVIAAVASVWFVQRIL